MITNREEVLENALRVFAKMNYEKASQVEIGKACGLTKAGLVYYYPIKLDLFVAVIDKYVFGVRGYEDRFEWLLNLSPEARGELDDADSPVYFKKITVTPDDERAWFRKHPQWSKSNRYAELEVWIFI